MVAEATKEALQLQCDRLKRSLYGPLFSLLTVFISSQLVTSSDSQDMCRGSKLVISIKHSFPNCFHCI
jgi:hypothetical protein